MVVGIGLYVPPIAMVIRGLDLGFMSPLKDWRGP